MPQQRLSHPISLPDFFSAAEALQHQRLSEAIGFQSATVRTRHGQHELPALRQNQRSEFVDPELSLTLLKRLQERPDSQAFARDCQGIYTVWRYYRYAVGDYFKWHRDGSLQDSAGLCSRYTLLIYLNADYRGGATQFRELEIQPTTGLALIFPHHLLHQSSVIEQGCKYVLRSDLLFIPD